MQPRVAIVGAGFGGLGLAIRLRRAGCDALTILEQADGIGGVWRDNAYPGLTCDIPSHLYSFSFAPKHDWTRRFPARAEILDYMQGLVDGHDLGRHLRLGTEVAAARFDETAAVWRIATTAGDEIEAEVLVTATGQLSRPADPEIEGLGDFEGPAFHSGRWDDDASLDAKRVAVVGTGASAIQLVPEIAPRVARLDIYQRSAPWVVPKPDRAYSPAERRLYGALPFVQSLSRLWDFVAYEALVLGIQNPLARRLFERGRRRELAEQVSDPALRERLTPDYPIGCKRILLSGDWYPTLQRENVEVITEPIARVRAGAIVTEDGVEHDTDAIVLATGFRATEMIAPMRVIGREGRELNEAWRDGPEAYLGLAVSGFPNLFILYGPNTNLGVGSILYMLESQIAYVLDAVRTIAAADGDRPRLLDVRPEVQRAFNAELKKRLAGSVWEAGCSNWYRTESGRITNNWPGLALGYRLRTRRLQLADYSLARSR